MMLRNILLVLVLIALIGCSQPELEKPKPLSVDKREFWIALAPYVKKHFDTGNKALDEIALDLAYADYLQQKKKDEMWERFSKEID